MKTLLATASLAVLLATGAARASGLNDATSCAALTKIMDGSDKQAINESVGYVLDVMTKLDWRHTDNGEPGIMQQLSDQGRIGMAAMTSVHCRQNPKLTIYNSAGFVYVGIRDMQMDIGAAK